MKNTQASAGNTSQNTAAPAQSDFSRGYALALRYLVHRQRSEAEVRRHLEAKGKIGSAVTEKIIHRLKEERLVDDLRYAQSWTNDRLAFRPKGKIMIKRELRQKGISMHIIDQVVSDIDDSGSALKIARKHALVLKGCEAPVFFRRLSAYLERRGYSREVAIATVKHVWESLKKK